MLEKEIENTILQLSDAIPGCETWKIETQGTFDPTRKVFRKRNNRYGHYKGVTDLVTFYKGHTFFIELKTKKTKSKVSEEQKFFMDTANANGSHAIMIYEVKQFEELIKSINKGNYESV